MNKMLMGLETMKAVAKAIGLEDQPLKRILIDIQLDECVHVYTESLAYAVSKDKLLAALIPNLSEENVVVPQPKATELHPQ